MKRLTPCAGGTTTAATASKDDLCVYVGMTCAERGGGGGREAAEAIARLPLSSSLSFQPSHPPPTATNSRRSLQPCFINTPCCCCCCVCVLCMHISLGQSGYPDPTQQCVRTSLLLLGCHSHIGVVRLKLYKDGVTHSCPSNVQILRQNGVICAY